ncbi:hypothetical protein QFC21_001267 [Naganishia friedmannii]|uniref:Uncharacterized protein n=1 Tax=Naganishia friedmannii TaxID=89922 RepID=A0ACC2W4S4_9TREE|nr:hypothetical protein QFC21_001267 [Naganishia friedmannii]
MSTNFSFVPDITLQAYRELWRGQLQEAKTRFYELQQRIRTVGDATDVWTICTPLSFLPTPMTYEAGLAKRAFLALDIEVATAASIADNLATVESSGAFLDTDSQRFLDKWQGYLRREGAFLSAKGREVVRQLTVAIQSTADEYLMNIRDDDIPGDYLASHAPEASTGAVIIRHREEDTGSILQYCQIQATREKVYKFERSQANPTNKPVLHRLLELRRQKSRLLGFNNYAEYQLDTTMMQSTEKVASFLEHVHRDVKPRAEHEEVQVTELLNEEDDVKAQAWDMQYGAHLLKQHRLENFDFKDTRRCFRLNRVLPGLFQIVENIFSLRFEPVSGIHSWHSSVSAYRIYNLIKEVQQKILVGRIFFDHYPREGKLDGASAFVVRSSSVPQVQLAELMAVDDIGTALDELDELVLAKYASELHVHPPEDEDFPATLMSAVCEEYGHGSLSTEHSKYCSFLHLAFDETYASRYYSYLFSSVICVDLLREFEKKAARPST